MTFIVCLDPNSTRESLSRYFLAEFNARASLCTVYLRTIPENDSSVSLPIVSPHAARAVNFPAEGVMTRFNSLTAIFCSMTPNPFSRKTTLKRMRETIKTNRE
jgi:hypothetical protein